MAQRINFDTKVLRGTVIKVKYYNENNYFSIFIMKCPNELIKKGYEYITCKGTMTDPKENIVLILNGKFVIDENYGKQFDFKTFENSDPLFEDEIIKYLSSGLINEVDYITAKKIYNEFGEDTIYILDNEPDRLLDIKGIGEKKYESILNSWKKHRSNLQINLIFQKLNISLNIVDKLKKLSSAENIDVKNFIINHNYDLTYKYYYMYNTNIDIDDDIDDIKTKILTFNNIDSLLKTFSEEIFEKFKKSFRRIQAAMYNCIQYRNYELGYTCQPYSLIIDMVSNMLAIDSNEINNIFKENYNGTYVIFENKITSTNIAFNNEKEYLYCIEDYQYEIENCKYLSLLNSINNKIIYNDIDEYINEIENLLNIEYNENQINAIKSILDNNITIITGGPGTGKTTIIKGIMDLLLDKFNYLNDQVLLLAPTGKAAKKLMESTNHRAHTLQLASWCKYDELITPASIIIIDEASMISNKLLYQFLKHTNNQKLVFIGDIYQLPSIAPGNILSDMIDSNKFSVITLNQIYRQENGYIISNAYNINNGIFPELNVKDSKDFFYINCNNNNNDYSYILSKLIDIIHNNISDNGIDSMKKELQILSPMKNNGSNGVNSINYYMQQYYREYNYNNEYLPIVEKKFKSITEKYLGEIDPFTYLPFSITFGDKTFYVGDRVINIKNDYENMIFNGETGIISRIEIRDDIKKRKNMKNSLYNVYVLFDDNEVMFTYEKLDSLQLAYALTIHKSQGSEYKWVIVFLNKNHNIMLQRNLLYTAITRAKEKVFLISDNNTIQKAIDNNKPNIKLTLLKERLNNEGEVSYQENLEEIK